MMLGREGALDPRTGMVLIVLSIFVAFSRTELYIEWLFVGSIFVLMYGYGMGKTMVRLLVVYLFLSLMQVLVIPKVHVTLATVLSVFLYFKMLFPCVAAGALFFGITSVRALLEVFGKMHVPRPVSIAVAVSVRYFPTLGEETGAIWGAMRLRTIKGLEQKMECMYVPLLMSAVKTGEELAQSAIVRGIENPASKSSLIEVRFHVRDMLVLVYFAALTAYAVVVR